ncbi:MAG: cytidylate kinase-like family protein [Clostridiales Family XIII bacterium]|jgi:cytidylate kinase|nr:cytidylate kinase-like family protein [Clostridiales Family XIII bacterium]
MKKIITISREYGSGGRFIGRLAAERLGFAFYDRDLIELAAKESGLAADFIKDTDESLSAGAPFNFSIWDMFSHSVFSPDAMPLQDQIHVLLGNIINDIASQEACVIVGRSADYILRDRDDCLNVFIHADREHKLRRVTEDFGVPERNAEKVMEKTDKARASYYRHYSGQIWGLARNYHLSIDSGLFGVEACADTIVRLARL